MTSHLPECSSSGCTCEPDVYGHMPSCELAFCICAQLEACEERVLSSKGAPSIAWEKGVEAARRDGLILDVGEFRVLMRTLARAVQAVRSEGDCAAADEALDTYSYFFQKGSEVGWVYLSGEIAEDE